EFLLSILAIKLWDKRAARDLAQMLTLSVFLSVGSILTSNSLAVGVLLLINVATLVLTAMVFHVYAAGERAALPTRDAGLPEARAGLRHLLPLAAGALVLGLAVSIGVWFLMPRDIGLNRLGRFGEPSGGRRTGFTDRVDLRRSGLISESTRPVMDVE